MKKIRMILGISALLITYSAAGKDETLKCVRWGWTGDVYERKVYCLEWVKKDCSQRLHKEICKQE